MSLIQQALEKTSRTQETGTTTSSPAPKAYERDPMGADLEQKLIQAQQSYARRRKLFRKIAWGALVVFLAIGFAVIGALSHSKSSTGTEKNAPVPQAPVRIHSGYIYRLTGISSMDSRAIAVINNRIVGVGDLLNKRAIVKSIGNGEVRLDVQGKEMVLTL